MRRISGLVCDSGHVTLRNMESNDSLRKEAENQRKRNDFASLASVSCLVDGA